MMSEEMAAVAAVNCGDTAVMYDDSHLGLQLKSTDHTGYSASGSSSDHETEKQTPQTKRKASPRKKHPPKSRHRKLSTSTASSDGYGFEKRMRIDATVPGELLYQQPSDHESSPFYFKPMVESFEYAEQSQTTMVYQSQTSDHNGYCRLQPNLPILESMPVIPPLVAQVATIERLQQEVLQRDQKIDHIVAENDALKQQLRGQQYSNIYSQQRGHRRQLSAPSWF